MAFFKYPSYTYNDNAASEIVPLVMNLAQPRSVIDIGCGTGTWLNTFQRCGVSTIRGVDHPETDQSQLRIDKEHFVQADLTKPYYDGSQYDLVVCLEVAEHLPAISADNLIKTLISHGDLILFSAAVPFQEGDGHVNEQWPGYWVEKFNKHGFRFHDSLRFQVWSNSKVEWWYKQNIFLIFNAGNNRLSLSESEVLPLVHPELYEHKSVLLRNFTDGRSGIREMIKILGKAIRLRFK